MVTVDPVLQTQLVPPPPQAGAALERRFTVGGVVSKTMRAWWRHLPVFTVMSIAVYAPFSAWFVIFFSVAERASRRAPEPALFGRMMLGFLGVWLLSVVLIALQVGAVTYATVRHLQGARARVGEMMGIAFRRFLPIVVIMILMSIGVFALMLFLLVPGIIFLVATCVVAPSAVVERPGIFGAFSRSFALTRGNRWSLFAAGLVMMLIVWVLAAIVQVAATIAVTIALGPERAQVAIMAVSQVGNVLFSAIPLVAISVAYHDLRVAKEGVDTASLAAVFE